ncbi:MAG: hypothetical protein OJF52_003158 [Nitrospira sp.]|nr:MAG: hypothetical protein OJF52_003158 [Nitrospira sp.]
MSRTALWRRARVTAEVHEQAVTLDKRRFRKTLAQERRRLGNRSRV